MQTVIFHSTIFGPIHSRRLGTSLGVNLMPNDGKVCTFDCIYCEAGFNAQGHGSTGLPTREEVRQQLEKKLVQMKSALENLDVITFSGNGEPTLHPEFKGIIDDTVLLRDKYFPSVKISVLSNATRLADISVCEALNRVDNNILKLDSAVEETVELIDRPTPGYDLHKTIAYMASFKGGAIIQTMFFTGTHNGKIVDNTTDAEVNALIETYKRVKPRQIMIYTIDRPTPEVMLKKVSLEKLDEIAQKIETATGIEVQVSA